MKKETILIADKTCIIYKSEQPEYLLIQPIDEHDLEALDNEVAVVQSLTNKSFTLVAFKIKDWQSELTPWKAPAVFGKIPFGDGAVATLSFIKDTLIPQLEQKQLFDKDKMQCVLGGYSLAGFFALWSAYRHLSGTLNGWSMQRSTSLWLLPFISALVIRKRRRRTPQWPRLATVFANNRNCWQHKVSTPFLNGIPAITSSILMKERPRDLHGSSIRTDKQDCQCLTEFKGLSV